MTSLIWNRHFHNLRILHAFAHHYSNTKMNFLSVFPKFSSDKMTLCNHNDQTWFSDMLTYARLPGVVKPLPFRFGFQHPLRPADINAKKNKFNPYIDNCLHFIGVFGLTCKIIYQYTISVGNKAYMLSCKYYASKIPKFDPKQSSFLSLGKQKIYVQWVL